MNKVWVGCEAACGGAAGAVVSCCIVDVSWEMAMCWDVVVCCVFEVVAASSTLFDITSFFLATFSEVIQDIMLVKERTNAIVMNAATKITNYKFQPNQYIKLTLKTRRSPSNPCLDNSTHSSGVLDVMVDFGAFIFVNHVVFV